MIAKWRKDDFIRHNAIFFAGNTGIGFLNYLFYPVLGRLLQPAYFGEVQTLFSLFSHIGAFMGVFGMVAVNIVANQKHTKSSNTLVLELEKLTFLISIVLFLLLLLTLRPVANFFHFGSVYPFLGVAIAMIIGVPITFRRAILQGLHKFTDISIAGLIGAIGKLVFAVIAVVLGYKTGGTITAIVITQIISLIYIEWRLRLSSYDFGGQTRIWSWPNFDLITPELKYAGLVLSVSLIIAIQFTLDILAVKHYFPPVQAGLYAGISTVSNVLFFLTGSISGVLLASVRLGQGGANYILLKRSFKLVIGLGGATLLVFVLFPSTVIHILLGYKYLPAAHYLPTISLAMFIVSLANLCYIYFMAKRRYIISVLTIIGALTTYILMLANHGSIQAIINNVIVGSVIMLALVVGYGFISQSN